MRVRLLAILCAACSAVCGQTIEIVWDGNKAVAIRTTLRDSVEVRIAGNTTAMLGAHQFSNGHQEFRPLWPFQSGVNYAVFIEDAQVNAFVIPSAYGKPPRVLAIYPTGETVPQNLLKVYIKFSQPMAEGRALEFLSLINQGSGVKQNAFLDLKPELWNEDRTLLTVWLDPGRIKRDLAPNVLYGAPLQEGNRYQLRISSGWPDQNNVRSTADFSQAFRVAENDRKIPIPENWIVTTPKPGTTSSLTIKFTEPMDYSLAMETISIWGKKGRVEGTVQLRDSESKWDFTPSNNWEKGEYIIRIESRLEDLAGNNLNRLFDRDMTVADNQIEKDEFELPILIK